MDKQILNFVLKYFVYFVFEISCKIKVCCGLKRENKMSLEFHHRLSMLL